MAKKNFLKNTEALPAQYIWRGKFICTSENFHLFIGQSDLLYHFARLMNL